MLTIVCCERHRLVGLLSDIMTKKNPKLIKFGLTIKEYRTNLGFTQEELAFKANLHRTYIGMIERGEKNITLLNIIKIASALDISLNKIFDGWEN